MTQQAQPTAEQIITGLKARMFDIQEQFNQTNQAAQQIQAALGEVAHIIGLTPNERGEIALEDVIAGVKALVTPVEQVEAE
ncbi:gp57A chaperone for tail fiber formation [Acinetobacter phage Ac42]|uniref:tail fiber chaperone n=1 Tax=Acinetobacter phage Ac42 TaxID=762660 RepID=UPI0001EBCD71|nr:tail fiber chaperone [Acinetobacter phage Ac42]ADI96392.1 gp57A chaperone for tail fiber formation [Acinetobacter phage Ac42]